MAHKAMELEDISHDNEVVDLQNRQMQKELSTGRNSNQFNIFLCLVPDVSCVGAVFVLDNNVFLISMCEFL